MYFFSTNHLNVGEIKNRIENVVLIKYGLRDTSFGKRIIFNQIGVVNSDLKKIDIENLLEEMFLNVYDYNFIKVNTNNYISINKEGFEHFLINCESELLSNIQVEKSKNIDKEYEKIKNPTGVKVNTGDMKSSCEWSDLPPLAEELQKEYSEKLKFKDQVEKIKKIVLKSLYYLQTIFLSEEELNELMKLYENYISEITTFWEDEEKQIRYVIHSICMLEKIYMTNQRLNKKNKLELEIFKILGNKTDKTKITYDLLEKELIKCLLFKRKDGSCTFNKISPSFYLTTPLRMSCLSYVLAITTLDKLISEESKINSELGSELKKSFIKLGEYGKFLSGSKNITDLGISKFSETYLEKVKDKNNKISDLYSVYFNYKESEKIKNNYSDRDIKFYEEINIEKFISKEKISKNIELYNFIFNKIKVNLSEVDTEKFIKGTGEDYVIYLNRGTIIKNTKYMSLKLSEKGNMNTELIKNYIDTSRGILENINILRNKDYCLVKFLEIKDTNDEKFYIFETSIVLMDFSSQEIDKSRTYGTQVITFILKENDFKVLGKVWQINYDFLCIC